MGIISCQQQTSDFVEKEKLQRKPVLSSYNSGVALPNKDYKYFDVQSDVADLDQIMTFEDAARFESRIGIGAPLKRVNRYIGKPRRDAINLVVSELENYQDEFLWPDWVNNVTPISFFERAKKRIDFIVVRQCSKILLEWNFLSDF